jgi:signal transduction histidine kinase
VFDLDLSGDVRIVSDPDRLFQVLANLAQNAVAHGRGPVSIRLHGAADHLELDVHNHGAPIPESLLPALFEPFVRGVGGSAAGLGLGLFITRKIVEGHGGTIDVRSTDIGGTTFAIRLPRPR